MLVCLALLLLLVAHGQLVCPPFCVGEDGNEFRALKLPLVFRGSVVSGRPTTRITGAVGEINYLVELLEVFKGGLFMKRVGKNVVHVYSGLGYSLGTECGVGLTPGISYLFAGQPHIGTSAEVTAHIDVNNCTLSKPWDTVQEPDFLNQVVQAQSSGRCSTNVFSSCTNASLCAACATGTTCVTNAFGPGAWCGACRAWCVPSEYTA